MALDLGDITFGITGRTKGLDKIFRDLDKLAAKTDKAARSQAKGAKAAASALAKQESQLRKNIQAVAEMRAKLSKAGAPAGLFADTTNALKMFSREMVRGKRSMIQFNRVQDTFAARMGKTKRSLNSFNTSRARKQAGRFTEVIRDLESASVLAVGPLSGIGARIRALGAITSRSTLAIAGMLGGIAGAIIGFAKLTTGAIGARRALDQIISRFTVATGSILQAGEEFEFTARTAQKFGLDLKESALQFSSLAAAAKGTTVEGEGIRRAFEGVSAASAALRLNADQVGRILVSLRQIMSKGTVMAEELTGQFGEQLPGGLQLAARAFGVTTRKMLEMVKTGDVLAEDFIQKIGKQLVKDFGEAGANAANTLQGSINRLSTSMFLFNLAVDDAFGASKVFKGVVDATSGSIGFLTQNLAILSITFFGVLGAIGLVSRGFIFLVGSKIVGGIKKLSAAMFALNAVTALNPFVKLGTGLALLIGALAGGAIGFGIFQAIIGKAATATDKLAARVAELAKQQELLGSVSKATSGSIKEGIVAQLVIAEANLDAAIKLSARKLTLLEQFRKLAPGTSIDPEKGFVQNTFQDPRTTAIVGPLEKVEQLREELRKLNNIEIASIEDQASKAFAKVARKVGDLTRELEVLGEKQAQITAGTATPAGFKLLDDLEKASKLVASISKNPLALKKLNDLLKENGIFASSAVNGLFLLFTAIREGKVLVGDFTSNWEKLPDALKAADRELGDIAKRITALGKGADAVKDLNKEFKRRDAIESFRKSIDGIGLSIGAVTARTLEFSRSLDDLDGAQATFDKMKRVSDEIAKSFERTFERVGSAITKAFLEGDEEALKFGNIVKGVLSEILQTILKMAIVDPFAKAAAGFLGNFIGNLAGGGFTGVNPIAGGVPSSVAAKGAAFPGGVRKLGKGGILSGPTLFPSRGGMNIGGEAGDEAVVPLKRTKSGELGVAAIGGVSSKRGDVIINIINNANANVTTQQSRKAGGGMDIDVIIDSSVAKSIKSGGQTSLAIQSLFGATPTLVGR